MAHIRRCARHVPWRAFLWQDAGNGHPDPRAADEGEAVEFYGNAGHMAATDHHLFSLDISDPLAFTKSHCETELNSAEHAIDLLKSLAINAER